MMYDYEPLSDEQLADMLNFELVPGHAHFKITKYEDSMSGNGNKMIRFQFKATNTSEEDAGKNGIVNHNLVFSPASQPFVAAFFRALGWLDAYKNKQWDSASFMGQEFDGIIGEEEFISKKGEPKKSLKVATFLAKKDSDGKPIKTGLNTENYTQLVKNHEPSLNDDIPF